MQLTALCKVLRYPALLNPKSWLIMKLTTILILAGCLQVSARTFAQTVTLSVKNTSLEKVFLEIKKQTGYNFVYNDRFGSTAKPVTVAVKKQPLGSVLEECFRDQNFTYEIIDKTIIIKEKSLQKKDNAEILPPIVIDVKGKVVNEKGEPLAGVSVLVKGTKRGTSTNDNGVFELKGLDENAVLQFTGVNIETYEAKLNGRTELNFTAKAKISKLEDVEITNVNTGYQSIPKERATGSFTQVDNKTLNLQVGSNILNRLEGVASSVALTKYNRTGSTIPSLTVRGLSTLNGPTSPLIILDNFPFEGDINSINPNMVESITILKDATAASIWGTKAGNGVIVINTKKGKFEKPLTMEFNNNIQFNSKPDIYYQKTISSSDYIDVEQFLFSKGFYTSQLNDIYHPKISPVVELMDRHARGLISAADLATSIASLRKIDVRDQYDKYVYSNSINSQYSLNVNGGNAQMAWSASGGYDKNNSALQEKYERTSLRIENSFKPINSLKITSSLYFTRTYNESGKEGYPDQTYMYPYSQIFDENGKAVPAAKEYRTSYTDTFGGGKLLDWNFYPGENYKHSIIKTRSNSLIANIGLQYQFNKALSFDFKYQYEMQQQKTDNLNDALSYEARLYVNLFSQLNRQTGVVNYIVPKGGLLRESLSLLKVNNVRGQLNFNKSWGQHQITAMTGTEIREIQNESEQHRTYGYDEATVTGSFVDYRNPYPTSTNGDLTYIPTDDDFGKTNNRFVSFYGNAAYTVDNKYSLTISGRRDASNLFGASTNSKWTPLWSAGLGWDLSRESFYRLASFPLLKLRVTYGYTGNADPRRTGVATIYSLGNSIITGFSQMRIRNFPNPTVRWEQVRIINIGLDFSSKNNSFSGSVDGYQKKGTDLFGSFPVDITTGLGTSSVTKNVADITGTGVDLVLNAKIIRGKFGWNAGIIFNYNSDKVTKAYTTTRNASSFIASGFGITALEGRSIHSIISFKWAGLDNAGNPQGYVDGKISKDYAALTSTSLDNLEYSGPALPNYFGSISNSISFKAFELSVNINYKFHYFFKRQGYTSGGLFGSSGQKTTADYALRWKQPGDEAITDIPAQVYPAIGARDDFYNQSSALVERGDNIRLQFVNLSYQLSIKKSPSGSPKSLQLYANASNLGIIWRANKKGIDPDYYIADIPPGTTYTIGGRFFF